MTTQRLPTFADGYIIEWIYMREKRDRSKRLKSLFVILFFVSLLPPFLSASPDEDSVLLDKIARSAKNNSMLLSQIKKGIIEVRDGTPHSVARSNAAEHLASLIRQIDPSAIDDVTLGDLIALLDIPDDAVRAWVAGALGDVGPRAHAAVPELLKILPEVDCVQLEQTGITSAFPIRYALRKIDGKEPPPPVCNGNNK